MKKLIRLFIFAFALQSCENKTKKAIENVQQQQNTENKTESSSENETENITPLSKFAEIVDKDGFVNIRDDASGQSKIIGKINSGEIVYIFNVGNDNEDWLIVDHHEKDSLLTGYVHTSRIKPVSDYEYIPSVTDGENGVEFHLRNIEVIIKSEAFNYQANKKYFAEEQLPDKSVIQKYKGQEIWGTDGTIPRTHYTSITARIGNQTIEIPKKEIENLFNINNELAYCYLNEKTETLYISSSNSDGSGSYDVLFIIEKGKYKGRKMYYAS